jgi:predicted XRE-type DNA-binding protein
MARNFEELRAKMSPESRARANAKAQKILADIAMEAHSIPIENVLDLAKQAGRQAAVNALKMGSSVVGWKDGQLVTYEPNQFLQRLDEQAAHDLEMDAGKTGTTHTTPADGNVFADLGFAPNSTTMMKANSDQMNLTNRVLKEQLMREITGWMTNNQYELETAANLLGITTARVADVHNMRVEKYTLDALVTMVLRVGKTVSVEVVNTEMASAPARQK